MFRHFPLILKNCLRNRRRSLLTIISIAASLCLLGMLLTIYHMFFFTDATPGQALRLITRNRVSLANPLPISYQPQIKQVPGVKEVMINQWFGGVYKDQRDPANFFARFALEADKFATVFTENKMPESELQAFVSDRTGCVIGRKTAVRHNLKIGDRMTIVGDIFPITIELTVRGVYDGTIDNESLFFHYRYLNESLRESAGFSDVVSTYIIRMERTEDANTISKTIDDKFRNSTAQTKTETEQAFGLSFLAFLGNVKLILLSICAAVTFTILLVSGNTMAMTVRERAREAGVLKTLGFTTGAVLWLMISEAVVIALMGGVIGLALTRGLIQLLRGLPAGVTFFDFNLASLQPSVVITCLLVAGMIGLISSLIPALGASRRPIVEALRVTN